MKSVSQNWTLSDIKEVVIDTATKTSLDFIFKMEQHEYYLSIDKNGESIRTIGIYHMSSGECVLCSNAEICHTLDPYKDELLHHFISSPPNSWFSWQWEFFVRPDIKSLELTNVSQKITSHGYIDIHFEIRNCSFYLMIDDKQGIHYPLDVIYMSGEDREKALYLKKILDLYNWSLFYHLIQLPSIRLYWLFIPYEDRKESEVL